MGLDLLPKRRDNLLIDYIVVGTVSGEIPRPVILFRSKIMEIEISRRGGSIFLE
jgi:hypothetical protein